MVAVFVALDTGIRLHGAVSSASSGCVRRSAEGQTTDSTTRNAGTLAGTMMCVSLSGNVT